MEHLYDRYTNTDDAGVRTMDEMLVRYNCPLISRAGPYAKKVVARKLFCAWRGYTTDTQKQTMLRTMDEMLVRYNCPLISRAGPYAK